MKKTSKIMAIMFLGVILTLTFAPMVLAADEGGGELSSMAKGIIGADIWSLKRKKADQPVATLATGSVVMKKCAR